ncbi:hypothetical protein B0I37DRAFT_207980 [Chaetomium sp. MPI-CAGE-AT-0009]|nr:hypothetical protein B0I37DRAFT_207980 [Chaetomium sp. MPI-CAGE-AT-0009]
MPRELYLTYTVYITSSLPHLIHPIFSQCSRPQKTSPSLSRITPASRTASSETKRLDFPSTTRQTRHSTPRLVCSATTWRSCSSVPCLDPGPCSLPLLLQHSRVSPPPEAVSLEPCSRESLEDGSQKISGALPVPSQKQPTLSSPAAQQPSPALRPRHREFSARGKKRRRNLDTPREEQRSWKNTAGSVWACLKLEEWRRHPGTYT